MDALRAMRFVACSGYQPVEPHEGSHDVSFDIHVDDIPAKNWDI
jgi:hypothetical protein